MDPVAGMEQTLTSILVMPRTNAMRPTCKWPYMVIGDMGDRLKSAGQYIQYPHKDHPTNWPKHPMVWPKHLMVWRKHPMVWRKHRINSPNHPPNRPNWALDCHEIRG